jgi:hypothetical protein
VSVEQSYEWLRMDRMTRQLWEVPILQSELKSWKLLPLIECTCNKNSMACSPQVNYTDRVTAACWQS